MYGGEGDESELASLWAPVVMSLSKTSLIFNGAQLQGKREERGAQNSHTQTHSTSTYADNTTHYTLVHACTDWSKLECTDGEHTHTYSDTQTQVGFSES